MGPASRLLAHSLTTASDPLLVRASLEDVFRFSDSLITQWRRNKLSEIDMSEESLYLHPDTLNHTLPTLWQVLKTTLFATVTILRAIVSRTLTDPFLASDHRACLTLLTF